MLKLLKKCGILTLSLHLGANAFAGSLACEDFEKIFVFVHQEHLRFRVEADKSVGELVEGAIQEIPEMLRSEGAYLLAATFEENRKSHVLKSHSSSVRELCEKLSHTRYRESFLKAYVGSLDPFSQFMAEDEFETRTSVVDGHFVGVGVGTKSVGEVLEVTEVVEDGPSHELIFVGDLISHIDGRSVRGMSLFDLRQRIRGPLHSMVEFSLKRGEKELVVSIKRDHVFQKSVSHNWVDGGILNIKIHRFYAQTAPQISALILQHKSRMKGIILDLRDNPGGLLQAARDVVDLFVSHGVVVHLKGTYEDQMWALGDEDLLDTPMVVLMNEKTASASEIVAGALQDYGRAVLVGSQTYGKSCVQNIYETETSLGTNYRGGLKLTTLWFYLPSGRSVAKLKPDIEIANRSIASVDRFHMPYEWPQNIDVLAFPHEKAALLKKFEGLKDRFSEISESEELGRALIRQLATY